MTHLLEVKQDSVVLKLLTCLFFPDRFFLQWTTNPVAKLFIVSNQIIPLTIYDTDVDNDKGLTEHAEVFRASLSYSTSASAVKRGKGGILPGAGITGPRVGRANSSLSVCIVIHHRSFLVVEDK